MPRWAYRCDGGIEIVLKGGRTKADLYAAVMDGTQVVIKDFGEKPWWVRIIGRIQISREYRAYKWLLGVPGVPSLVGRIDPHAIAIERIDGVSLPWAENRYTEAESHIAGIQKALAGLHGAGVAHMDLRGRENVMVTPGGGIVIIDLAAAVCLRPGSLMHRLFFRWLTIPDRAAYLKWKLFLTPEALTDREKLFMKRFNRTRGLWIFNRKKRA